MIDDDNLTTAVDAFASDFFRDKIECLLLCSLFIIDWPVCFIILNEILYKFMLLLLIKIRC